METALSCSALEIGDSHPNVVIYNGFVPIDVPKPLIMCAILSRKTLYINILVRAAGIEPAIQAWEARVLPLYYARAREDQR